MKDDKVSLPGKDMVGKYFGNEDMNNIKFLFV